MPGPHVLLSSYAARVISCGPGVLSSFVTLPGWSLWFFILASASAGRFGYSRLYLLVALFPGAGVGFPLLSSRALWRRLRPLPCSLVCGLHCTGPTNARQLQWETVISCAVGRVFPGPLGLLIVSDASGSFLPQVVAGRSYRRSLSPSGSGCRYHSCAGSRSWNGLFCVP